MAKVNFASIAADASQEGNVGGFIQVVPILGKTFSGNWPIEADITAGEINVAPRLPVGTTLAVYELPVNTIDAGSETEGEIGGQVEKHSIEFYMAGFKKEVQVELKKFLNAGGVFLVNTGDLKWGVVGTSYKPIFVKKSQKFGKKGSDMRGTSLKGEETGYLWPVMPLSTTVVTGLTFAAGA